MMDVAAPEAVEQRTAPLVFTGKGTEYFGIWIVNLALSVLTLGIYSAWAKVRRLKYFYRNTALDGASFEYHGDPVAILKGRIVAVVLLVAYQLGAHFDPMAAIVVAVVFACVLPWLLLRSLRFRLYNSSYRGLRFSFHGSLLRAYGVFLVLPALASITLYLLGPVWHHQLKHYQHGNGRYGTESFHFHAPLSAFYGLWLRGAGLFFAAITVISALAALGLAGTAYILSKGPDANTYIFLILLLVLAVAVLLGVLIVPYLSARLQNLVWNNTSIGPHRFISRVSARRLLSIMATNLLATVLTLGLFRPFAAVRLLKYRIESVSLVTPGDLESFAADQPQSVGATGEETADLFDIDIAL